ncbi:MAG: sugar phosphate nucleotidyltransferase [Deltaproteobacteria bacterium]|nr:sugar phosphate nucleotidyltransferase [Deltaproteobacteria bacterium]
MVIKAVIPAAGIAKRFWPVTKIIPKELLPVVTTPSLHLVLKEAGESGLEEIVLIVSAQKIPFFEHLPEFFPKLKFHFVEQKEPLGLGHAVGLSKKAIGENPFAVLLPDVIFEGDKTVTSQLIEAYGKTTRSVNAAEKVPMEKVSLYGVHAIASSEGRLHRVKGVVEKPKPEEAPSNLVVSGRYFFTPEIFPILKKTAPGRGGEIQLADAMDTLAKQGGLYAYEFEGKHFDIGNPKGYIEANRYFGAKKYADMD